MPLKHISILLLLSCLMTACVSIKYQAIDDSVEGYADKALSNNQFEVTFQTYHNGNHLDEIKRLALKRAAEISTEQDKEFFIVLSEETETKKEIITIPEQKLRSFISMGAGGLSGVQTQQEIENIIPAHHKEYNIQKITLLIKPISEQQEGAFIASEY